MGTAAGFKTSEGFGTSVLVLFLSNDAGPLVPLTLVPWLLMTVLQPSLNDTGLWTFYASPLALDASP